MSKFSYSFQRITYSCYTRISSTLLFTLFLGFAIQLAEVQSYPTTAITSFDGVTADLRSSFYRLDGTHGIQAPIVVPPSLKSISNYYVKMWVRSTRPPSQLGTVQECLFDIQSYLTCSFTNAKTIQCDTANEVAGTSISVGTFDVAQYQWLHVAVGGGSLNKTTYLMVNYLDQNYKTISKAYKKLWMNDGSYTAFLGISSALTNGFQGDIREFFFSQTYIPASQVQSLMNQVMLFDNKYLAYYRFVEGALNEAQSFQNASLVSTGVSKPQITWENLPNDQCYPFQNYATLPFLYIKEDVNYNQAGAKRIDARYKRLSTKYQYSASFWLKSYPGSITSSDPFDGNAHAYLIRLFGVFAVWFTDPNHIATYIYSITNYEDNYTAPMSFPMYQWANYQLTINQQTGYEVRIYNLQRQLMSNISVSYYMADQQASGFFNFNNIVGYVKSVLIYQTLMDFPINTPSGQGSIVTDSVIVYYKFDKSNFQGSMLQSLGQSIGDGLLGGLNFTYPLSFDQVMWEESISFSSPSPLGTLLQNVSLFDGIACNDQNLTMQTSGSDSYASYNLQGFQKNQSELTVELWFKYNSTQKPKNYLLTIVSNLNSRLQYFQIFQDTDSYLKCIPFQSSAQFPIQNNITINHSSNYNYTNYFRWQHISCSFKSLYQMALQYDNLDGDQFFYAVDTIDQNYNIPAGGYTLIIGNSPLYTQGLSKTFYKEVRVWSKQLSTQQILKYLYSKVDPQAELSLMYYFQMASGNQYIYDFNSTTTKRLPLVSLGFITNSDSEIQICPEYAYNNMYEQVQTGCSKSPYITPLIVVLAEPLPYSPYLQYHLTSQFSEVVNEQIKNPFSFNWTITDANIQSQFVASQTNKQDIYLPANALIDGQQYIVTLQTSNLKYTFSAQTLASFIPVNCRYLGDSVTGQQINELIQYQPAGIQDITFSFGVFSTQGYSCGGNNATAFQQVNNVALLQYYPEIYAPNNVIQSYNSSTGAFKITILADSQLSLPFEKYLNIIATVQWQSSSGNIVSQSIVYRVMFAYTIDPTLSSQYVNILVNQQLLIYAGNSSVPDLVSSNQSQAGLSYGWQCPTNFNSCTKYDNSRYMKIVYSDFVSYQGQYDTPYVFGMSAWRSNNYDSYANFSTSWTVNWRNVQIPSFQIVQSGQYALASQNNTFYIDTNNYEVDDPNLFITWSFYPNLNDANDTIWYQEGNTVLTVLQGGFSFNSSYSLKVSILNIQYPVESLATQTFNFSTGTPPTGGTVAVSPGSGQFLQTKIAFSIKNWVSKHTPITYKLYGIQQQGSYPILLTSSSYAQGSIFNSTLPSLVSAYFLITDARQEVVKVPVNVKVIVNPTINFGSLIKNVSQTSSVDLKYQNYGYIVQELNLLSATQSVVNNQQQVLNNIASDLSSIAAYNTSNQTLNLIMNANNMIPLIMSNFSNINSSMAQQSYQILTQISISASLFSIALTDPDFQSNYAQSLSLLLSYASLQMSGAANRRMRNLQSSSMSSLTLQVLQTKQAYTDAICKNMNVSQAQTVITPQFETDLYKAAMNSTTQTYSFTNQLGTMSMVIPLNSIIQKTLSWYNVNQTSVCIQASYYYMSLFAGTTFPNQTQNLNVYAQIDSVDNLGNRAIDYGNINSLPIPYSPSFSYNFGNSALNFTNYQTTCMYINTTLTPATATQWFENTCSTVYSKATNTIQCQCTSMGPYFYTIGNDLSIIIPVNQSNETGPGLIRIGSIAFSSEILSIIIILLLIDIFLPLIAILNDRRDYNNLKQDVYDINDDILKRIALMKEVPLEQLLYKKQMLSRFQSVDSVKKCSLFTLFLQYLHPIFGIIFKFDIEMKRLIRYMIVLYQLCIICLISTGLFGVNYRSCLNCKNRIGIDMDSTDIKNAIVAGAFLSLLTLPLPNILLNCIKTKLVLEEDIDNKKGKKGKRKSNEADDFDDVASNAQKGKKKTPQHENEEDEENEASNPQTQQRLKSGENEQKRSMKEKDSKMDLFDITKLEDPVTAIDNCIPLKILLIMLSQALIIGTVVYLGVTSSNVTRSQTLCIVVCWFTAVLGGWFIINVIRIVLITFFAPPIVENERENEGQATGQAKILDYLFVPTEAKELISDMFLIYQINLLTSPNQVDKSPPKKKKQVEVAKPKPKTKAQLKQEAKEAKEAKAAKEKLKKEAKILKTEEKLKAKKKVKQEESDDEEDEEENSSPQVYAQELPKEVKKAKVEESEEQSEEVDPQDSNESVEKEGPSQNKSIIMKQTKVSYNKKDVSPGDSSYMDDAPSREQISKSVERPSRAKSIREARFKDNSQDSQKESLQDQKQGKSLWDNNEF